MHWHWGTVTSIKRLYIWVDYLGQATVGCRLLRSFVATSSKGYLSLVQSTSTDIHDITVRLPLYPIALYNKRPFTLIFLGFFAVDHYKASCY
jgi:hypothetical protein